MAVPKAGIGTLLKRGDGASPEVFTTVARVGDISGPSKRANTYDTSSHDSTDNYSEFVAGMKEGGEVSFTLFFDANDTGHVALDTDFEGRTRRNWQIAIANSSPAMKWSFSGVITALDFQYPVDGVQTASCTIKVSGKPALGT